MARYKTVSVETGTVTVSGGSVSVVLESEFLSTPVIYISPGSTEPENIDPGNATTASWNSNAYVTAVSNSAGAWTFTINTEEVTEVASYVPGGNPPETEVASGGYRGHLNPPQPNVYEPIKLVYRAIGPVSAV